MNEKTNTIETLRQQVRRQRSQLDLIQAIDYVRDTLPEPTAMLSAIATVVADHLQAELCLLCLVDRDTGDLELRAVNDRRSSLSALEPLITRELAQRVLRDVLPGEVVIWDASEVLPASAVDTLPPLPSGLQVAAVPIVMGRDERLGTIILVRSASPFAADDVDLLQVAESQIDSAVVQGYAYHDLQQRNKELEAIYRIDRIRDQNLPFDDMLHRVLRELQAVIEAEMAFVMLYNRSGHRLELRATTRDDLFRVAGHHGQINRIANEALQRAELVCYNDLGEEALRSVMCIPLILQDEIIGVLGVVNRYGPHGFRSEDRRLLNAIGSQMDTAIFESLERRRLREVLGRSVDPRVMEQLLQKSDVDFLKGERMVISVLYADLRGSTGLAERTPPEILVEFVNDYLGRMTDVILTHQGTLDKFVGDEVMALFGAPFPQPDHALRAVRVGLEMQAAHTDLMAFWRQRGIAPPPIGVGIATGELIVGEMGCPRRTDYTVIGRAANLGSRLCGVAEAGQVLVSQETYDLIRGRVQARPVTGLRLKGVTGEVTAYHILRI